MHETTKGAALHHGFILALLLAAVLPRTVSAQAEVEEVWSISTEQWLEMKSLFSENSIRSFGETRTPPRVLRLGPKLPESGVPFGESPAGWRATVYDYEADRASLLDLGADGSLRSVRPFDGQPVPNVEEFRHALELLSAHPHYGRLLSEGLVRPYRPMPPVDLTPGVPRTVHVGLLPREDGDLHEIVGVRLRDADIISYGSRAPRNALADPRFCGVSDSDCDDEPSGSGVYRVKWPNSQNPIWDFTVVRPDATTSVQSNGTGVEIRDVYFKGQLVLLTAHVPVLNVKYDGDTCGPYRDWLDGESCFDLSNAQQVQPGFFTTPGSPQTLCETGMDTGSARGVAIEDKADFVLIASEMEAGWYRYVHGWKFHENGDIGAIFQYSGTANSCTCNPRTHHVYWRFDFGLGGSKTVSGWNIQNVVEQQSSTGGWNPLGQETRKLRSSSMPQPEFRVLDKVSQTSYGFEPHADDGTAANDPFAKSDIWLLKWNANEISDASADDSINLSSYLNNESTDTTRVVVWYGGHLRVPGGSPGTSTCTTIGPTLRRSP